MNSVEIERQHNQNSLCASKEEKSNNNLYDLKSLNKEPIEIRSGLELGQKDNKEQEIYLISNIQLKRLKYLKCGFIGLQLAAISIQISLYTIQYTSSKISLSLFLSLLISISLLALFIIIPVIQIRLKYKPFSFQAFNQLFKQYSIEANKNLQITSTVPKLHSTNFMRDCKKTKKLKFEQLWNHNKLIKQTFKKFNLIEQNCCVNNLYILKSVAKFKKYAYIALISKLLQNLHQFVTITLCFVTLEDPNQYGFGKCSILLLVGYLLILVAFVIISLIIYQLIAIRQQSINRKCAEQCDNLGVKAQIAKIKAQTAYPIYQQDHLDIRSRSVSIENNLKNGKNVKQIKDILNCENVEKQEEFSKAQITESKRSVLKNSQYKLKCDKTQKQERSEKYSQYPQRRKVQINSKRIQYFEYANISASNSVIERQLHKNVSEERPKKAYYSQKKYKREKLTHEDKILRKYREKNNRKNISKSVSILDNQKIASLNKSAILSSS